jgi:D-3-phosphoglycerate dehydrogenase
MPRVCIPDDAPPVLAPSAVFPALRARAELVYHDTLPSGDDDLIARLAGCEIALNIRSSTRFTERVFAECSALRLVSIWGTGTDHVDLDAAARYGVAIASTPGVSARSIAEHTLALLLAAARRIPHLDACTRRGGWERGQSVELTARRAGSSGTAR